MPQYSILAAAVPNSVAVEETAAASDAKGGMKAAAQIEPNAAAAASRKTKVNDHR